MGIYDYSTTAGDNTQVGGVSIAENMNTGNVNNAMRAQLADLAAFIKDAGGALTAGGSANALTLTSNSSISGYADGQMFAFVAAADNTGAATLSVDAVGAKAIRKNGDAALTGGEIVTGGHYIVQYDASANTGAGAWLMINPTVTGLGTMSTQDADAVDISGGEIDGTPIGANSASTGVFTKVTSSAGSSGATAHSNYDDVVAESSSNSGITVLTPNTGVGGYMFKDPDNASIGDAGIYYEHSTDRLTIGTLSNASAYTRFLYGAGTEGARLTSTGFGIGKTPTEKLDVNGNVLVSGTATFGTVDINGGAIDGTPIGASSASTGAFTTLTAGASFQLAGNSIIRSSAASARGNVIISAPNYVTTREVSYGNNLYIDSAGSYQQDSSVIGGAMLLMSAPNGTPGEFIFISKQDPDVGADETVRLKIDGSGNVAIAKTSASEKLDVNGTVNATGYKLSGTALPVTKGFESAEQTITSAGSLTIAHGLGVEPQFVTLELVCKTAEVGYSVNEVIGVNFGSDTGTGTNATLRKDATNLIVRFGNAATTFYVNNGSSGAPVALTNANWRLIVRAFA